MAKIAANKDVFYVVRDQNTGKYLCDHKLYGTLPVVRRVVVGNKLFAAKHFENREDAQKFLNSRCDFRHPSFNWRIVGMEAHETEVPA